MAWSEHGRGSARRARTLALCLAGVALGCTLACTRGEPPRGGEAETKAEAAQVEAETDELLDEQGGGEDQVAATGTPSSSGEDVEAGEGEDGQAAAAAAAEAEAGPVYFLVEGRGIVRLDAEGLTSIQARAKAGVSRLLLGPAGEVLVLGPRSLSALQSEREGEGGGERLVEVERFSFDEVAPVGDLAFAPDGEMWLIGSGGVGTRVEGAWVLTPLAELGLNFSARLAISGSGRVWLVGKSAAYYREDDSWAPLDVSRLGAVPLLQWPRAAPGGPVFATNGKQLIRLSKSWLELTPLGDEGLVPYGAGLDIAPDGQVGLARASCDLVRVDPQRKGGADGLWRFAGEDYRCETAQAIALDGRHRFWVASREGLSVVGPEGVEREYPAGSFVELAGRVRQVLAVGRGPELPPELPVKTATLVGELRIGDELGAGLPLELCPTVRVFQPGSLCASAEVRLQTTTDAQGRFRVEEAPIADYSFAVEVAGKWRWRTPPSFAAELRPDEEHDLGTLSVPAL